MDSLYNIEHPFFCLSSKEEKKEIKIINVKEVVLQESNRLIPRKEVTCKSKIQGFNEETITQLVERVKQY